MKQLAVFLVLFLVLSQLCTAQNASIKGTVIDTSENKNLTNSVITILRKSDSVLTAFTRSDNSGQFSLKNLPAGKFFILITHPAYADYMDEVSLTATSAIDLDKINMILKSQLLQEVIVSHGFSAIRIKGDTVEYKADSFYLSAGSTVEDLLKKLPGITVDKDGKISAQGQTVQKVLVDGEEFFSDDPTIVTRGFTADAVDKVQVFDKKSDQAEFTGIDDGQRTKTIDLKLKEDRKKGYFGKLELGSDGDELWNNNVMLNAFKGKRKFSAFGIMSNTGKTGLSFTESMNYGSNNSGMEMGMSDDGGMYISISNGGDDFGGSSYYGEGLPKGWSGGLHYSNKWNEDKLHINSGYQFNKLNTAAQGFTQNQNLLPGDTILYANEDSKSFNSKDRHRVTGLYEWQIDSLASVKITAQGYMGTSMNNNIFNSESLNNFGDTLSLISRQTTAEEENKSFSSTLLWRQKFRKNGRTFSLSVQQNYRESESAGFLFSDNIFYDNGIPAQYQKVDQQKLNDNILSSVNSRMVYTEPLSKRSLLEFSYTLNNNHRQSGITTLEKPAPTGKYDQMVDSLSNDYSFNVFSNAGGISYRYAKPKRLTLSFGLNIARADYTRKDIITKDEAKYSFTNFFPQANMSISVGQGGNIRFNYNGSTRPPSIDQIQPIQDNTDQLNIRVGNPDLKQAFRHSLSLSFNSYKFLSERNIFANLYYSLTQNDFSTLNTLETSTGKNVSMPVNVDGNYYMYGYLYYSKKIKKLGVWVGFNSRMNKNRRTNFVNGKENISKSYSIGAGPSIRYELEKKIDLWIEPNLTWNVSESSIQPNVETAYWTQEHRASVTFYLPWKLELNTDIVLNLREKTNAFERNNNSTRWNARIDRKIFKKDAARLRFSAYDILDQNIGFNRNISSNFISERTYNTFRRYFMLSFIWNFNKNGNPVSW